MKIGISAWSIHNPIPVSVLFIALMIAGIVGYKSLPIKLFPDVSFPVVQVTVTLSGAAASEIETQITREVEGAVSNISGVNHVQSIVSQGLSTTTVEFDIGEDPQRAIDEIRAAVDGIRSNLPRGVEEPIVQRFDIDSVPIVTYAVVADGMTDVDLSWFIDNTVTKRLITQQGVAQVVRVGGVEREINVTLDPNRMEALGVTAHQINEALLVSQQDLPGGRAELGQREQTVRILGASGSIETLSNTVIATNTGHDIKIKDIASVALGASERRGFAILDGKSVVGFQVKKTKAASDVAMAKAVAHEIEALSSDFQDVSFNLLVSSAQDTQNSFTATVAALVEGLILAALVVFIFLRSWRATIIAALAMPISLIPTFAMMSYMGFSLNMITLLALTLVIGVLVDDAIVEIENIQKRIEKGESPFNASLIGADEIGLAVVATTLTIVVVFLPVSLMGGFAGQFFKEFGFTVAVAVLFSLLVARLLIPLMAAYFLRPVPNFRLAKPILGLYRQTLEKALHRRWLSIGLGAVLFFGSLLLTFLLPSGFNPPQDNGIVMLTIEGAPGATLNNMRQSAEQLSRKLMDLDDVDNVFTTVGSGDSNGDIRSGKVTVLLNKNGSGSTQDFYQSIKPLLLSIPDVRIGFAQNGAGGSNTIQILLAGDDADLLDKTSRTLELQMRSLSELSNVYQLNPRPGSELIIAPKPVEAARLGVNTSVLAAVLRVATLGEIDAHSAKFNTGEQRLPIRVRLPDEARSNLESLKKLGVPTSSGKTVPLSAVADIRFQPGASRIERFDRTRRTTIEAQLNMVSLGEASKAINQLPILQNLPDGITQPIFGQRQQMEQLFSNFGAAMFAGVGLIFSVLVLLFRSFFKPVTILAALPLSLAGAFFGLLITRSELGLSALIGLLMLMGLAAKNSILLVELAIEQEINGMPQKDALLYACHERVRPIVMTTLAMAAGMLPTALGIGEGSEFRAPMAIAVIGGLISSTLLSLVLVPVVYELVDDFEIIIKPKLTHFIASKENINTSL